MRIIENNPMSASQATVRNAYLRLSKRYHPDKLHSSMEVDEDAPRRTF